MIIRGMTSIQMMKPALSFLPVPEYHSQTSGCESSKRVRYTYRVRVSCKAHHSQSDNSSSEERPESLFMKELRRRGITPTSLLEESRRTIEEEIEQEGDGRLYSTRNAIATDTNKSITNQREQSMALNSEGLEGLIPRAKLLLRHGGTFVLAFGPLILLTMASFAALYLYFGPTFIHDASDIGSAPPQYLDPYELLKDDKISP